MPTIPVNLADVEAFENLPLGEYEGEIKSITFKEPREEGKYPQLQAAYTVTDEEQLGRVSSEFISLSPKAAFRLKRWFAKFGLEDTENLDVDDETNELVDPDLVGTRIRFKVWNDKPAPGETEPRVRTSLTEVLDEAVPTKGGGSVSTKREESPRAAAPARRTLR